MNQTDPYQQFPVFLQYYTKLGILREEEHEIFRKVCESKLPVAFRVSSTEFQQQIVAKLAKEYPFFQRVEWLSPQEQAYVFTKEKKEFKIDPTLKVTRNIILYQVYKQFLVDYEQNGLIQRQELVSMLPIVPLQVHPGMQVLDLCSAPGSKSKQIAEKLQGSKDSLLISNDKDFQRATMAAYQVVLKRSPNMVIITSNDAAFYPSIQQFDRILCDVPCTGDGTMRKTYDIFKVWGYTMAHNLHPLQIRILLRGLYLLKPGGILVYSTCSLNPIEDEAVVQIPLKELGDCIQLVPSNLKLVHQEGLADWDVCVKQRKERLWLKIDDDQRKPHKVRNSMYPLGAGDELKKCCRVLPHQNDTGGFFLATFTKNDNFSEEIIQQILTKYNILPEEQKNAHEKSISLSNIKQVDVTWPNVLQTLNHYAIKDTFDWSNCITSSEGHKKINNINDAVKKLLFTENKELESINFVMCGAKIFELSKDKIEPKPYRGVQETISFMAPYFEKQIITIDEEEKVYLLKSDVILIKSIQEVMDRTEAENRGAIVWINHCLVRKILPMLNEDISFSCGVHDS